MVEAMDGSFVSYSRIWLLPNHQSAHIEPVATDPDYRRLGLGKAAVMECIRRCALLGAKRVIVALYSTVLSGDGF